MKIQFSVIKIFTSLALIVGFNFQPISRNQVKSKETQNNTNINLTKEYLRKFSDEQYIIDSGDVIKIIISRDYPELTSTVTIDGDATAAQGNNHTQFTIAHASQNKKLLTGSEVEVYCDGSRWYLNALLLSDDSGVVCKFTGS